MKTKLFSNVTLLNARSTPLFGNDNGEIPPED